MRQSLANEVVFSKRFLDRLWLSGPNQKRYLQNILAESWKLKRFKNGSAQKQNL